MCILYTAALFTVQLHNNTACAISFFLCLNVCVVLCYPWALMLTVFHVCPCPLLRNVFCLLLLHLMLLSLCGTMYLQTLEGCFHNHLPRRKVHLKNEFKSSMYKNDFVVLQDTKLCTLTVIMYLRNYDYVCVIM